MSARALPGAGTGAAGWLVLGLAGLALTAIGVSFPGRVPVEAWFAVFVLLAGIVLGSLGLLTIGHLMSEEWLGPIRSEAEAAALTAPCLFVLALPLLPLLPEIYPWSATGSPDLPQARAAFLAIPFFVARGALYLSAWTILAVWITRTSKLGRASAIALAPLAATAIFAGNDWVLSRDPLWWSSLFGFAFCVSQLLAALAGGILVSLLRPEHPSSARMRSLERALLTLALLTLWIWFVQFLVVWLANLPNEAAWYLARYGDGRLAVLAVAFSALLAAVFILAPPGFGRRTMIVGSTLLLLHHAAYLLWLLNVFISRSGAIVGGGLLITWAALFGAILRTRPIFDAERGEQPS
jgi:hypothetical protein